MSFAGFKKQLNKANQYVSEKMGSAEGTKMDDEFVEMERKTDAIIELTNSLTSKTKEMLRPNSIVKAKTALHMAQQDQKYPQAEGLVGDVMLKAGQDIGANGAGCEYASALLDLGSSLIEIAEARDRFDESVHLNLLSSLHELDENELKPISHDRKKLQGRRLDYDCKRRKQTSKTSPEEVKIAEAKFEESKCLCRDEMKHLLSDETKMIEPLLVFVVDMLQYNKTATTTLEDVLHKLNKRKQSAVAKLTEAKGKTGEKEAPSQEAGNAQASVKNTSPLAETSATSEEPSPDEKPSCRAKFDFNGKKEGELSFKEGEMIILSSKIDADWFEGTLDGKHGKFPSALVQIIKDLPTEAKE